jgi:hypothetical protein
VKPTTRDNLIYLAVALGILALLVVDTFYSLNHHRKIWVPSRFAFSTVTFTGVLAYMVATEVRKAHTTTLQTLVCVLVACVLHAGIVLAFPQIFAKPFSAGLWIFVVLELFLIVPLMRGAARFFRVQILKSR